VVVENGWVTLTGEVDYYSQKTNAESSVQHLTGVKGVSNLINVKPKVAPQKVKEQIEKEFHRLAALDANHIQVEANDSRVILKGKVSSWAEYNEAETAAWSVAGVTGC
jgi:osmotically-inducible protein OsmY